LSETGAGVDNVDAVENVVEVFPLKS